MVNDGPLGRALVVIVGSSQLFSLEVYGISTVEDDGFMRSKVLPNEPNLLNY